MNQDSKNDLWLADHLNKCRCCFEKFDHIEKQVEITEIIEEQFLELTKVELKSSPNFSNKVCMKCTSELQSISSFRLNLITKQQLLYEFVITSPYKIQDVIFEPVDIKIETQATDEINNIFKFETQYEETPEAAVIYKTTAKSPRKRYSLRQQKTHEHKVGTKVKRKAQTKVLKNEQLTINTAGQSNKPKSNQTCSECGRVFLSSGNLSKHIRRVHLKLKHFFCDFCGYVTLFKNGFMRHMKIHLSKPLDQIHQIHQNHQTNEKKKHMCPHCGIFVACSSTLLKHIRRVHLKLKHFFCDLCSYGTLFKYGIIRHMMTHLPMELREKFNCDQCKYITISFWHMNNHKREEHGTKSKKIIQRCECQCGKVFDSIKKLKVHKNYAHNVKLLGKKHICTICSKAFMHSSELRNHMEVHKGPDRKREIACDVCGKMFFTLKNLRNHSIHHKDPKFICSIDGCTKKFFKCTTLENHKKTHIDQRDFACHLCDKKYFASNHLNRHILHFHKQLKLCCELPGCSSKFARKETYRNHVLSHHKDLSQEKIQALFKKIREIKQE